MLIDFPASTVSSWGLDFPFTSWGHFTSYLALEYEILRAPFQCAYKK